MENLFTVDQAAKALTVSHWTLRYWLKTGKVRGSRIGSRRVIRESELQRLIVDDPRRPRNTARKHPSAEVRA